MALYRSPRLREFVDVPIEPQAAMIERASQLAPEFYNQAENLLRRYHQRIQADLTPQERQALRVLIPGHAPLRRDEPLVERILQYDVFRQLVGNVRIETALDYCITCTLISPGPALSVRGELELMDSQWEDIGLLAAERDFRTRDLQSNPRAALQELLEPEAYEELAGLSDVEVQRRAKGQIPQLARDHHQRVVETLLAHQRVALVRLLLNYYGNRPQQPFGIYGKPEMSEWFDLAPQRQQQLSQAAEDAWPEFYREYTELVDRYELRVREVLRGESRQQWDATFGRPFVLVECFVLPNLPPPDAPR